MSKLGIILCLLPVVLFMLIVGFAIWDHSEKASPMTFVNKGTKRRAGAIDAPACH